VRDRYLSEVREVMMDHLGVALEGEEGRGGESNCVMIFITCSIVECGRVTYKLVIVESSR
jgi:hypothetical protein